MRSLFLKSTEKIWDGVEVGMGGILHLYYSQKTEQESSDKAVGFSTPESTDSHSELKCSH